MGAAPEIALKDPKGKEYKLRFTWKKQSENTALWEQAYFDEKAKEWETNWTMEFIREN